MARSAVPRAAALVVAIALLPWVGASQVGGRPAPSMSSERRTSALIGSLSSPLVVTPDRPKVWPDSKRTDEALSLLGPPPAAVDTSRPFTGVFGPASMGSVDVLGINLAERGPPLLAT